MEIIRNYHPRKACESVKKETFAFVDAVYFIFHIFFPRYKVEMNFLEEENVLLCCFWWWKTEVTCDIELFNDIYYNTFALLVSFKESAWGKTTEHKQKLATVLYPTN